MHVCANATTDQTMLGWDEPAPYLSLVGGNPPDLISKILFKRKELGSGFDHQLPINYTSGQILRMINLEDMNFLEWKNPEENCQKPMFAYSSGKSVRKRAYPIAEIDVAIDSTGLFLFSADDCFRIYLITAKSFAWDVSRFDPPEGWSVVQRISREIALISQEGGDPPSVGIENLNRNDNYQANILLIVCVSSGAGRFGNQVLAFICHVLEIMQRFKNSYQEGGDAKYPRSKGHKGHNRQYLPTEGGYSGFQLRVLFASSSWGFKWTDHQSQVSDKFGVNSRNGRWAQFPDLIVHNFQMVDRVTSKAMKSLSDRSGLGGFDMTASFDITVYTQSFAQISSLISKFHPLKERLPLKKRSYENNPNQVNIHLRGGDYCYVESYFGVVAFEYYWKALLAVFGSTRDKIRKIVIFHQPIDTYLMYHLRFYLKLKLASIHNLDIQILSEHDVYPSLSELEITYTITETANQVIASNSSFSLLALTLNQNPQLTFYQPHKSGQAFYAVFSKPYSHLLTQFRNYQIENTKYFQCDNGCRYLELLIAYHRIHNEKLLRLGMENVQYGHDMMNYVRKVYTSNHKPNAEILGQHTCMENIYTLPDVDLNKNCLVHCLSGYALSTPLGGNSLPSDPKLSYLDFIDKFLPKKTTENFDNYSEPKSTSHRVSIAQHNSQNETWVGSLAFVMVSAALVVVGGIYRHHLQG